MLHPPIWQPLPTLEREEDTEDDELELAHRNPSDDMLPPYVSPSNSVYDVSHALSASAMMKIGTIGNSGMKVRRRLLWDIEDLGEQTLRRRASSLLTDVTTQGRL